MRSLTFLALVALFVSSAAQDESQKVIDADTVTQLRSVTMLEFVDAPEEAGVFSSGWFIVSDNAQFLATVNRSNEVVIWTSEVKFLDKYVVEGSDGLPAEFVTANFGSPIMGVYLQPRRVFHILVSVHWDGEKYYVHTYDVESRQKDMSWFDDFNYTPADVWIPVEEGFHSTMLDMVSNDPRQVDFIWGQPLLQPGYGFRGDSVYVLANPVTDDDTAFVRIGRIPPPFAVTSTQDGLVKLWDLENSELAATAQVDGLPVFGQINASGSHLAWRDPDSTTLHLLNFETGEDKLVARLDGEYIQFMFLTLDADVIIGVNVDFEPVVVAWDAATGERYELGAYRECSRVPDMARLSKDGTALVIGCDTGLDIWRVKE